LTKAVIKSKIMFSLITQVYCKTWNNGMAL